MKGKSQTIADHLRNQNIFKPKTYALLQHTQNFHGFGKLVISYRELKFCLVINFSAIKFRLGQLRSWYYAYLHHDFPETEALHPRIQTPDVAHEMKIVGIEALAEPLVNHGHRQG